MQAADKKLIIEKGADFRIQLEIVEGVGFPKDLTNFTASMYIQYYSEAIDADYGLSADTIYNLLANGTFVEYDGSNKVAFPGVLVGIEGSEGLNGEFNVIIDKSITATFPTMLDMTKITNRFGTDYNFFYQIEIDENSEAGADDDVTVDRENMRVLRGKLAVRN